MPPRRRGPSYDATLPSDDGPYGPEHEDYMSPEEKAEILRMFKSSNLQPVRSEAEAREYIALLDHFTRPEPISGATWVLLLGGTIAAGVVTGLIWKHYRQKKTPVKLTGLDLLGAS